MILIGRRKDTPRAAAVVSILPQSPTVDIVQQLHDVVEAPFDAFCFDVLCALPNCLNSVCDHLLINAVLALIELFAIVTVLSRHRRLSTVMVIVFAVICMMPQCCAMETHGSSASTRFGNSTTVAIVVGGLGAAIVAGNIVCRSPVVVEVIDKTRLRCVGGCGSSSQCSEQQHGEYCLDVREEESKRHKG